MEYHLLIKRISAVVLTVLGLLLGVTWNSKRLCLGDTLFHALGLPSWSNGNSGTHYPAIIGSVLILAGIGILNSTLNKRSRLWIGLAILLVLAAWNLVFSYT